MKSFFWKFALTAAIAITFVTNFKAQAADKPVSPSVAEVVRLQKAGTPEEVMLAHVRNSTSAPLNSEDVLYLHDAGVSKTVIMAMLKTSREQTVEASPAGTKGGSGRLVAKPEWEQSANAAQAPAVSEPSTTGTATSEAASVAKPAPVVTAPLTPPAPVVRNYYAPRYYPYYGYYDWYRPSISIGFGFGSYWGGWGHGHHHHHGHGHGIHYRGGGHHGRH
jgi:hypothetical protein